MKRKQFKRLLATALTAAMVTGLTACGGSTSEGSKTQENTQAKDSVPAAEKSSEEASASEEAGEEVGKYTILKDKDGNTVDLGGMEVILRDWWTNPDDEKGSTDYDEALEEYRDWVQETYNFTFVQKAISSWTSTPEDFSNYVSTNGDDQNYLFILRPGAEFASAMSAGYCWDLAEFNDVLDFSEDKWKCGVHNFAKKGDKIFAMSADFTEPKGGMYFNKRVLKEAGINPDDLYTWQDNGQWTWDKFEECLKAVHKDTDGDGVIDRFGMSCITQDFYPSACYSNGGAYVDMDASGKLISRLEDPETIEALNWSIDIIDKYNWIAPEGAEWNAGYAAFAEGQSGFIPQEAYFAKDLNTGDSAMKDDFGFVCFPKGPQGKDYANIGVNNPVVIPSCYDKDKAWKLAFAYNVWTEPIAGFDGEAIYRATYLKNMRDTESVDSTITKLMNTLKPNYLTLVPGIEIGPDLHWKISKDNTPAQQAEAVRDKWKTALEEANK